jgi:hypothetical protein
LVTGRVRGFLHILSSPNWIAKQTGDAYYAFHRVLHVVISELCSPLFPAHFPPIPDLAPTQSSLSIRQYHETVSRPARVAGRLGDPDTASQTPNTMPIAENWIIANDPRVQLLGPVSAAVRGEILGVSCLEGRAPGFLSPCFKISEAASGDTLSQTEPYTFREPARSPERDSIKDSIGSTSRSIRSSKQFFSYRRLRIYVIAGKVIAKCAAIRDGNLIGSPRTAGDARGGNSLRQVKPECCAEADGGQR